MKATLLHQDTKCNNVKINCYSGISGLSHDEYITIDQNNVIWSCGSKIIKSFHLNPSITPNTDIPMTLRSATKMNIDTPLNYFKDNTNDNTKDTFNHKKIPFINDNAFNITKIENNQKLGQHINRNTNDKNKNNNHFNHKSNNNQNENSNRLWSSNQLKQSNNNNNNKLIKRENNENVNTDNTSLLFANTKMILVVLVIVVIIQHVIIIMIVILIQIP